MIVLCPICNKEHNITLHEETYIDEVWGTPRQIVETFLYCSNTDTNFSDDKLESLIATEETDYFSS